MSEAARDLQAEADLAVNEAINHAVHGSDPIVIIKSPPGAGKTFLVECACAVAVDAPNMRVVIVTPGVSQAYDIAERLLDYDLPRLAVMHARHRNLPEALRGRVRELKGWDSSVNQGPGIIVANAHVLAAYLQQIEPGSFDLLIVDEAYQLDASNYMTVSDLAVRNLLVGDPGQLPPVASVDTANLEASLHKIHWSVPDYVLDIFPDTPVHRLPVTRRLTADTTSFVQPAFYPNLPFRSVVSDEARRLDLPVQGIDPVLDRALDAMANGASLIAVTLPGEAPAHEEADSEVAAVMARIVDRLLQRQATWRGTRRLVGGDIGCIDPHVIGGAAISAELRRIEISGVYVDTVERWQGLQTPITVVRHPLSRIGRPTGFDLEEGRWCVALTRHQLGCVIVTRRAVGNTIEDYLHRSDEAPAGAEDDTWSGFKAHRRIWQELETQDRMFHL